MAKKTKLTMIDAGFYDLRRQPGIVADLERRAEDVRKATIHPGYKVGGGQGEKKPQGRWHARVYAATLEAKIDDRRHNTLVRAFRAARG